LAAAVPRPLRYFGNIYPEQLNNLVVFAVTALEKQAAKVWCNTHKQAIVHSRNTFTLDSPYC
jgi:hypothetical protein